MNRTFIVSILALSVSAAPIAARAATPNLQRLALVAVNSRESAPVKPAPISTKSFEVDYSHALSPQQMEDAYLAAVDEFFHVDHSS